MEVREMRKKTYNSTRQLVGIKSFSRNGLITEHGELVYFIVTPTNISVLSQSSVTQKVQHLMQLLCAEPDIEIVCMDARENYEVNKQFLNERIKPEDNKKVKELLQKDIVFLDDIQMQMSTSREFMFVFRLKNKSADQLFSNLNRIEKLINEQSFSCHIAVQKDIEKNIHRYFCISIF
jgi:actin-related protein